MSEEELQREVESLRLRLHDAERERARLRAVVERGAQLVTMTSREGLTLYANAAVSAALGWTSDELVGRSLASLVAADDEARVAAASREVRAAPGTTVSIEARWRHRDGSLRWLSMVGTNLLDDPAVGAVVCVGRDVTERRRAEEGQRRNDELSWQAQKMEAVSRLAGGIAHDFNNLLSVIIGYSSLLVEATTPDDHLHADILEVRKASERGAELTRQLLAFSRHQTLQPRVIDLNQCVTGMERMLRRVLGGDVELSLLTARSVGHVYADQGQVEQALLNLVLNARDAMPRGGKLTVETANVTLDDAYVSENPGVAPGAYVMLSVTDTGVGMDAETRQRIFDPFFSTKPAGRSSGLGLSMAHGIVRQSGGHIGVTSEPGHGTAVRVYLPCTDRPADVVPARPSMPVGARGSETVLLVDDDEQVRAMGRTLLRRQGYTVLEAQNGGEAILVCEQYPAKIHLLLTDVVMPRMSGRQLAGRVSQLRPDMRVMFISGYADGPAGPGMLAAGSRFLQKPLTADALLAAVREVLDEAVPEG